MNPASPPPADESSALPALRSRFRLGALGVWLTASALAAEPVAVSTLRPSRGDITRYVTLPGTLRAHQQVVVQARVAGFVKRIAVDRGDPVSAGQVLAEIEVPELLADRTKQAAEARVAEAEARRLEAGRGKSPDLVPPQVLEAAAGRLEVARAELARTDSLLAYATLTAPFAGTVTARFVDEGAYVPAGAAGGASSVVSLAETRVLRVLVPVPETESIHVKVGQPVRLTVEGLTNVLQTSVRRHAGAIDEATRTLPVEAEIPNVDERLRPGMFASVRLGLEEHVGVRVVPTESVLVERAGAFVFLVREGACRKTPVKLGFQDGPRTEISSGIEDGAVIIVPAKSAPGDGVAVRIKEGP